MLEANGFPANRFAGRLSGYMYAVCAERINPQKDFRICIDIIRPYVSSELNYILEKTERELEYDAIIWNIKPALFLR